MIIADNSTGNLISSLLPPIAWGRGEEIYLNTLRISIKTINIERAIKGANICIVKISWSIMIALYF